MRRLLRKQGASAAPKPSSVKRFKHGVAEVIGATVEGLAGLGALIGAPVAMVLGKLFLAVILGAVALGVFLRFADRQRRGAQTPVKIATPAWVQAVAALVSAVEVAVLVEATKLPVRHDQPDFTQANWLLVLLAWGVAYTLQARWLGAAVAHHRRGKPTTPARLP
ncbi:MAG TPA: hypothetical protein PLS11_14645 [Ottowia sp.]|jgi:hypothetical protein|nr:hypothetical protein [Ottowia sp.]HRM55137.1 hypothetical protein [Ottowia sp.]HRN08853.1 hypothetical protein [Ottowia sp.]